MDEQTTLLQDTRHAEHVTGKRRVPWGWVLLAIVVVLIAIALLHRTGKKAATAAGPAAQPVSVATASTGDMPIVLTELGTVTPLATVTVRSQISGYLLQVNFREGQEVRKGDLLALVDPRAYEATLAQYEGTLAHDQASLKQAQVDLARYQLLGRQNSIAKQTLEDQVYTVAQYQGSIKTDQGQIDAAKLNIEYCHIRAPVDGRVGLRQVDQGNYVTAGDTNGVVVLTQLKPMSVLFTVPEDEIDRLMQRKRSGEALPVDAYDRSNTARIATGRVDTVDTQVDTSTGTVKIRALFPNDDEALFPSQFVNARLLLDTERGVTLVPTSAIQTGPQGSFVYVVQADDTIKVQNVKTGAAGGGNTVIANGIAPGTRVVTDGTDHLRSGSKVSIPGAPKMVDPNAQPAQPHRRHHRQDQG